MPSIKHPYLMWTFGTQEIKTILVIKLILLINTTRSLHLDNKPTRLGIRTMKGKIEVKNWHESICKQTRGQRSGHPRPTHRPRENNKRSRSLFTLRFEAIPILLTFFVWQQSKTKEDTYLYIYRMNKNNNAVYNSMKSRPSHGERLNAVLQHKLTKWEKDYNTL